MKTFNRLFFLTISFGFLFAENKLDSFNLVLNDPDVVKDDNDKEHPVYGLKQKLDKEKSEKDGSLSSKIESEKNEKERSRNLKLELKRLKENLKNNRKEDLVKF